MSKRLNSVLFARASVFMPGGTFQTRDLFIEQGVITHISIPRKPSSRSKVIDCENLLLIPGLIDLHVHGAMGADTMEATPHAWETIAHYHARNGTTALALTTVAAPLQEIHNVLKLASQKPDLKGAQILGIHIEGPYLSLHKKGAHLSQHLHSPQELPLHQLIGKHRCITQITLAPELPGAIPLIRAASRRGIIPSLGHSDASDTITNRAILAGAKQTTHLFNCMASATKNGPYRTAGILEECLANPQIHCEIIADGYHTSPTLIRLALAAKGSHLLTLVSDATAGTGLPQGSTFQLGSLSARVAKGHALSENGTMLAGSTITLLDAIRHLHHNLQIPLETVLPMATSQPAKLLGIHPTQGEIRTGTQANLVLLDSNLHIKGTWVRGKLVA